MTELDFDELDKAVNSLMSDKESAQTVTPDASAVLASTPSPAVVVDNPTVSAAPSPAVRRRGQFMDMVHPSSNMRSTSTPVLVRRQAADITPLSTADRTGLTSQTESVGTYPSASPSFESTTESTPAPVSDWPDPIDMATPPASEVIPEMSSPDVTTQDSRADDVVADFSDALIIDDPQTSPFLPDTKVEKRPLGSPLPQVDSVLPDMRGEPNFENDVVAPDASSVEPEQPVAAETSQSEPMPDELKDEVIAVEANEVVHEEVASREVAAETPAAPAVAPDAQQSTATGVIVPQYQEQPSTGDQTNGPIYDTNTYHQPLDAQPHKKKSAVLTWILWTLVLLIVGATAGAAWFYFTTQ